MSNGGCPGECGPTKHVSGAEPGERVTDAGTHAESRKVEKEEAKEAKVPFIARQWVRISLLVAASILVMFGLYYSVPLQPEQALLSRFKPSAIAKVDDAAQRQSQERILIAITNNTNPQIE
jgi:hypothetical protein